jgi:hypothetical protein
MSVFSFKLEHEDRTPAEPPTLKLRCPTGGRATRFAWRLAGLRVIATRVEEGSGGDPVRVLVVEPA